MQKWLQKILLLLAVVTVMGHNVLPHHHHEDPQANLDHDHHKKSHTDNHHHDQEHHNNDDQDTSPLGDANHSSEFGKVISKPVSANELLIKAPSHCILLQVYVLCLGIKPPPFIKPPIENCSFYSSVFCHCFPLRAPPAIV